MDPAVKVLQARLHRSQTCYGNLEREITEYLQRIEALLAEMDKELLLQQSIGEAIDELRRGHKSPELQA